MTPEQYNYSVFDLDREQPVIDAFGAVPVRPGTRAPSYSVEDLDSGEAVEMTQLWRSELVILEFGSFT